MIRKSLLAILLTATAAYAVEATPKMHCTLSQEGPVKVTWKAYKTPFKLGVGGTFDKALYTPAANTLTAEITMNNIPKQIPMKYSYENGTLTAQGNDVAIGFTTKIKALCKPLKQPKEVIS